MLSKGDIIKFVDNSKLGRIVSKTHNGYKIRSLDGNTLYYCIQENQIELISKNKSHPL